MRTISFLFLLVLFQSCKQQPAKCVDKKYIDSLLGNYAEPQRIKTARENLAFWKARMEARPDDYVNGPKYASALVTDFQISGSIKSLQLADSLLRRSNEANMEKEPGLLRSLASVSMLQHRFALAGQYLQHALEIEGRSLPNLLMNFDVSFETGDYAKALKLLGATGEDQSYGYLFRLAKYDHYEGNLDGSIHAMMQAANKAANNRILLQAALSNAADLYLHEGNTHKAAGLYKQSITIDPTDFHSIMGLGWLALVKDQDIQLANKIFLFVKDHYNGPEPLLKLEAVAEARGNKAEQVQYAEAFLRIATRSEYGSMYNKYCIDLLTTVLNRPAEAVALASKETLERPTPQVFAWYAWTLYCNGQKADAWKIYKGYVSQKPLEALELYYMGRMMEGMKKEYNAKQFYNAAEKNRYDLSPLKWKAIEASLND